MSIRLEPPDATFVGPFSAATTSKHLLINDTQNRVCVKIKTFNAAMLQVKPPVTFITAGQQLEMFFYHTPFPYNASENYQERKAAALYIVAPETATDPVDFAKQIPMDQWKFVKIGVKYELGTAKEETQGGGAPAGTPTKKAEKEKTPKKVEHEKPAKKADNEKTAKKDDHDKSKGKEPESGSPEIEISQSVVQFNGPFSEVSKSEFTLTNKTDKKVCVKVKLFFKYLNPERTIKGFDNNLLKIKPAVSALEAGGIEKISLVHNPFKHEPHEYPQRKVIIFFVEIPESAADPMAFAKDCPQDKWKQVAKMGIKYVAN